MIDRPIQKISTEIDWGAVRNISEEYMDAVASMHETGHDIDEDIAHYMCEEVLKAVYGPDVFKWINARE